VLVDARGSRRIALRLFEQLAEAGVVGVDHGLQQARVSAWIGDGHNLDTYPARASLSRV
jgi:hypothetical protein